MSYSQIAQVDNLRFLSGLTTTYQKLGTPIAHAMRLSCLSNTSSTDIILAITNGSTPASDQSADQLYVAAGGFKLFDITSNKVNQGPSVFCLLPGQQIWARNSDYATGIFLELIYGQGET